MPLAVEWTNLHQILRSLYADMLPLCSDMMGIAKGLAGLGALFFIAYRVWKSLAAAEPIEVFPLLRPFVLGLCIMAFPTLVLGPFERPIVTHQQCHIAFGRSTGVRSGEIPDTEG